MLFTPPRRKQRVELAAILLTALFMLLPAAASAHRRTRMQAQVSEEAATGALQEPTSSSTASESPAETGESSGPSTGEKAGEPSGSSSGEETSESPRRSRREERRERRQARADARADSGCTVELQAPQIVTSEASLTLTGTVSCPELGEAGEQTVTLYQKLVGTPGYTAAATSTTEADGDFQFQLTGLGLNSAFYVRVGDAKSARIRVQVAPSVTIASPTIGTPLFTGGGSRATSASTLASSAVTFAGTVSPADAGATVILEREFTRGGWVSIGAGHVNEEGNYSIAHTFSKPGVTTIRVVVRSHRIYMKTASTPVTYLISPRRKSAVTIQPSSDPLPYGSAVTLSGTIAGPPDQNVTLYAQTGTGAFVPVAKASAVGSTYTFSQSPLQSTRYRVASALASSPVLAETVTFALTSTAAPASATVGETLTFTGSVTPAHEGQQVDLERENLSGLGGYHVIASGTTSSSGAYSLAYAFHEIGSALLRISVPGNTEVATAGGEPFKLAVMPIS
jgi:hypothetical protein